MKAAEYDEFRALFKNAEQIGCKLPDETKAKLNEWRPWPFGKKTSFWATDYGKCQRRMFWELSGVKMSNPDMSDDSQNTFAVGNKVEEHVVEKYRRLTTRMWEQAGGGYDIPGCEADLAMLVETHGIRAMFMLRPTVGYKMDLVFDDIHCNIGAKPGRYIIEVKSRKEFPFSTHANKAGEVYWYGDDTAPPEDYYMQLQQYLYGENVVHGLLHLFNKNDGAEIIWHVTRNEQLVKDVVHEYFRALYHAYVMQECPDHPYHAEKTVAGDRLKKDGTDWQCMYCPYSDACWNLPGFEEWEWENEMATGPAKPEQPAQNEKTDGQKAENRPARWRPTKGGGHKNVQADD